MSQTCLGNLASAPLSRGVLILDIFFFYKIVKGFSIRLSKVMLLYHSQLMSHPRHVPLELHTYWLSYSSLFRVITLNIHFNQSHLFRGIIFKLPLPP